MALTKVSRGLLSTGIVDNSNATAITINADESVALANKLSLGTDSGDAFNNSSMVRVQTSGNGYVQLKTSTTSSAGILFGDTDDDFAGGMIYDNNSNTLYFNANNAERLSISSAGEVTMPSQPAFSATPSSIQYDIPLGGVTVVLGTEIFDTGSNFASNTFTAPVTGKYQLTARVRLNNVDSAATYYVLRILTSNRSYNTVIDPDFGQDAAYWTQFLSVLADMDAGDTCLISVLQLGGAAQTDIHASSYTNFSGYLVA